MPTTSDQLPLPTGSEPVDAQLPGGGRVTSTGRDVWPLVRRLHFYAGVFVAPFLVLAALTGLAYAFTPQFDGLLYGDELRVESATGTPRPLADQVRAAQAAHPEGTVVTVTPPAGKHATTAVAMSVPALGEKQRTVYVDPYTGTVKGALTTSNGDTPLTTWLDELHRSLHLGVSGRLYSELAASWLWVIVGGGLLLWLGRRRQYRGRGPARRLVWVDRSARGVRRSRGRHAVAGVWLATVLLFLSATGLTWSDHAGANFDAVQGALRSSAPELDTARPGSAASPSGEHDGHGGGAASGTGDPAADIDRVLATGRAAGLSGPVEIGAPEDAHSAWTVAQVDDSWPVHRDKAAIDAATGQVTARVNWADHPWLAKLSTLGIQFHMGRLFGPANQVLLAATALGLLWIIFWGYRMWWQRRPTRAARTRFGRPPARGTWRRLPRTAVLLGIPVVALVGWAVPLFGITLLAFLLFDAALAVVRRRSTGGGAAGEHRAS